MSDLFRYNWELKRDNTVEDLLVENIRRRSIFKFNYELEPVELSNATLHQNTPGDIGSKEQISMIPKTYNAKPLPSVSFAKVAHIDSESSIAQNNSQSRIKRPSSGQFQIDLYLEDSPQKKFRSIDSISTFSLHSSKEANTDSELDSVKSIGSVKTLQLDLDRGIMMQLPFSMRETVGGSLHWEFSYDANLTD